MEQVKKSNKPKSKRNWIIYMVIAFILIVILLIAAIITAALYRYSEQSVSYKSDYGLSTIDEQYYDYEEAEAPLPEAYENESNAEVERSTPETAADKESENGGSEEQKVIKTGNLTLVVKKVGDSVSEINSLAVSKDGFILSSSIYTNSDETQSGSIVLKVPVDRFEETVEDLKKIANVVEREALSGKDVTEEYSDLQAQMNNYKAEEEQYLEILKRANTIEETLKVTEKLSLVRGKIERLEGQIKYLENQTEMSTITVTLKEETRIDVPTKEWKPWTTVKNAFRTLVRFLQGLVDVLIWIVIFLGPPALIIWLIIWMIVKRKRKKT